MGRAVDARTDIFSLGVVLYEMLSGARPFTGVAATEVLLQIVMAEPPDIAQSSTSITPALAAIVRRCMSKQAEDRYANCEELRRALLQSLRDDPTRELQSKVPSVTRRRSASFPATPPGTKAPARESNANASGVRRHALVADDDPATRYLLGSILQKHQISFDEAENGADAVRLLKNNEYSLLFIDLLMPRIDGWGVLDYLRSHRPKEMPRTFIVTGVRNQKLSTADQDIVTGLLYKPIDINQVESAVA